MNKNLSLVVVTVALALSAAAAQVSADESADDPKDRRGAVTIADRDAPGRP